VKKFFDFRHFKSDILGGITAGIVALPLALAFGEQSGLGAAAGLYGAAFIAFFAAMFGGTPTQISGPTAPMTALSMVVVAGLLQAAEGKVEQALPVILMVFLMAGLFQILLGVLKLGSFIRFIPYTVVSGFMTGIGVIILITQIPPALGYYSGTDQEVIQKFMPEAEEVILDRILQEEAEDGILVLEEFRETIERAEAVTPSDISKEAIVLAANDSRGVIGSLSYLRRVLSNINMVELLLTIATIFIIYGFKRITKAIPSTLVALFVVSGGAILMNLEFVKIREIPAGYPIFQMEMFTQFHLGAIGPYVVTALLLALLGAIDSLLTSVVADNMTKTQHNPNKELIGQGIGNGIAAMFGGLPGAGATIRTVVNIQAGGRTKLSGMTAGILLFVILVLLGPIASKIPAAVLAGILITVGIGVMDYKGLKAFRGMHTSEKIIMVTVLTLTVFWQLVYAVGVGLVMAAMIFLKRMSDVSANRVKINSLTKMEADIDSEDIKISPELTEKVIFKDLDGPLFFGFVSHFRALITELPDIHLLVLKLDKVPFMDLSGVYALEGAIEELHNMDVIVLISGANEEVSLRFKDLKIVPNLINEEYVFDNFKSCTDWLKVLLEKEGALENELKRLKS
jgi:sulfate permease, SulP family